MSGLRHLPGVSHLHVIRPLEVLKSCTATEILRSLCFSFPLGITVVPREIGENEAYSPVKLWFSIKLIATEFFPTPFSGWMAL